MPMDPQIEAMLASAPAWPPVSSMPVEELRAAVRASSLAIPPLDVPLASISDDAIEGPGGPIPIRIYTPAGEGPFPGIVYFHGGGWVVGDLDTQDMIARGLAHGADAVVVSVDYRLSPEHPFPAAPDDAWAATLWTARHAAGLNIDPARLAVAGDSAGANLAAGVALRARDAGAPKLVAQAMFYGSGNYPSEETPSSEEFAKGPLLSRDDVHFFWRQYLADPDKDQHHPLASPIRAASHAGLPPAYMGTAEIDPSRDDGERYAAKLEAAGVPVETRRYAGMVHGFVSWLAFLPGARTAMDDACAFLKRQFAAQN
ncbi:acetyl esterase [Sphingomonas laterariae]|uniref:Acetyl esterase n=1 Tax=Edaphosphingomonas laterariae TaxID=861865 RepID=A0A239I051_9SPHN|nr:alpha/beta hydrolase [Sphingomonas laterariae]SNS86859.1 acetyl esterase [Sphingomonas laterariae]